MGCSVSLSIHLPPLPAAPLTQLEDVWISGKCHTEPAWLTTVQLTARHHIDLGGYQLLKQTHLLCLAGLTQKLDSQWYLDDKTF